MGRCHTYFYEGRVRCKTDVAVFPLGGPTLGCAGRYGEEKWAEYLEQVPYRIVPRVY